MQLERYLVTLPVVREGRPGGWRRHKLAVTCDHL